MSRASEEYQMAIRILREAGFSNSAIDEMVCQRIDHRDKFGMAALTGLVIWDAMVNNPRTARSTEGMAKNIAKAAYSLADAMMEARRDAD